MKPQAPMQYTSVPGKKGNGQDMLTSSGAGDVEALNKILNNINVQTKKNDLQATEGKLPRKHIPIYL
jgi:hypothetical protein